MHEILDEYRPDFLPGDWSDRDRHFLEVFATNPDGIVSVLRNLPPEITGALCSRASRASGSLLEVLLKEYIYPIVRGDDTVLARDRKSTRLNSSHPSISYAVFCLKKKKKEKKSLI